MTEPMSQERLERAREIDRAAMEPPWTYDEDERVYRLHGTGGWSPATPSLGLPAQRITMQILKAPKRDTNYMEYWPSKADSDFLTEGRQLFRDMIAEIDRLRKLVGEVQPEVSVPELEETARRYEELKRWLRTAPVRGEE